MKVYVPFFFLWNMRLLVFQIKSQTWFCFLKKHVTLLVSLLKMKKQLCYVSLFLCLSGITVGPYCQNCVVKSGEYGKKIKRGHDHIWGRGFKLAHYGLLKQTISLQIFWRLYSTNFTWSILELFVSYNCNYKNIWSISTWKWIQWKFYITGIFEKCKSSCTSRDFFFFFGIFFLCEIQSHPLCRRSGIHNLS